jgi:hypothetical protein
MGKKANGEQMERSLPPACSIAMVTKQTFGQAHGNQQNWRF